MEKLPTIEQLNDCDNVSAGIEFAKTFYKEYPAKPPKPVLKKEHTSVDAKNYSLALEIYEQVLVESKFKREEVSKFNSSVDEIIKEYIKQQSGFYQLPIKAQEKVWEKAWQDAHSYGFYDVYIQLELAGLF